MTQHTLLRFASLIIFTLAFTARLALRSGSAAHLRLGATWRRCEHGQQLLGDAAVPKLQCCDWRGHSGRRGGGARYRRLRRNHDHESGDVDQPTGSLCCYYCADRRQQRDYSQRGEHRHRGLTRADTNWLGWTAWHQCHVGGQSARRGAASSAGSLVMASSSI